MGSHQPRNFKHRGDTWNQWVKRLTTEARHRLLGQTTAPEVQLFALRSQARHTVNDVSLSESQDQANALVADSPFILTLVALQASSSLRFLGGPSSRPPPAPLSRDVSAAY
jgi:hypothetical protein